MLEIFKKDSAQNIDTFIKVTNARFSKDDKTNKQLKAKIKSVKYTNVYTKDRFMDILKSKL